MVKQKTKKVPYLAVLLPVLLMCMAFVPASAQNTNAADSEAPFSIESVREECERLTATDDLEGTGLMPNGEDPTIETYIINIRNNA